jgi:hypothetical protein
MQKSLTICWVKLRAARALTRQRLGCRYVLDVVLLDPSVVRGTHGRLPDTRDDSPVLVCSDPSFRPRQHRRDRGQGPAAAALRSGQAVVTHGRDLDGQGADLLA